MPAPLAALPTIFTGLTAWLGGSFAQRVTNLAFKLAVWVAVNGAMLVSVAMLVAGTIAILDGISTTVPQIVNDVWGWFMPTNTADCLLAIIAARFLRAYHDFRIKMLELKLRSFS